MIKYKRHEMGLVDTLIRVAPHTVVAPPGHAHKIGQQATPTNPPTVHAYNMMCSV